jgi:hypothetical protein
LVWVLLLLLIVLVLLSLLVLLLNAVPSPASMELGTAVWGGSPQGTVHVYIYIYIYLVWDPQRSTVPHIDGTYRET